MHGKVFLYLSFFVFSLISRGQTENPEATVERFFKAFHLRDSLQLKGFFTPEAQLQTLVERPQQPTRIAQVPIERFIRAVATRPETPVWEERLGKATVLQHQGLAQVWVPYRFVLDGKTSHCGYNSFQLVRLEGEWRVNHLIDTRTSNCEDPAFPEE